MAFQIDKQGQRTWMCLISLWKEWIKENSNDSGNLCRSEFMPV